MPDMQPLLPTKSRSLCSQPISGIKDQGVKLLGATNSPELTLPLALPGHHVSADAEVQALQDGLQAQVQALPQPVVHGQGPQQHHEHCSEQEGGLGGCSG